MYTASQLLNKINTYISESLLIQEPKGLYEPIRYALSGGGKRIRPLLTLMAYNLYKEDVTEVYAPAAAIEIYHNCTLLHDDLMDKSDMRRGKETVHKVWGDNTAILSGDAMLILAYRYMANCPSKYLNDVLNIFNQTMLGICEGQQYDMEFERRNNVAEAEYLEMIKLKTAILLAAGLKIGALLGDASEEDADELYDFGVQLGIAFQLKDDFLDVYGDPEVFGKNIGRDILSNKKTYMLIKTLELADDKQNKELGHWLEATSYKPEEKINAVTAIYNQLGIKDICAKKSQEYYERAIGILGTVSVETNRKQELEKMAQVLMCREL